MVESAEKTTTLQIGEGFIVQDCGNPSEGIPAFLSKVDDLPDGFQRGFVQTLLDKQELAFNTGIKYTDGVYGNRTGQYKFFRVATIDPQIFLQFGIRIKIAN